jgi:hypothetical protein
MDRNAEPGDSKPRRGPEDRTQEADAPSASIEALLPRFDASGPPLRSASRRAPSGYATIADGRRCSSCSASRRSRIRFGRWTRWNASASIRSL